MDKLVTYEKTKNGYGLIYLNRPDKRNAISKEMRIQLKDCIETAKSQTIKFLVITGTDDRMFSAGGDLSELHGELSNEEAHANLFPMMEVLELIVHFPVPVIALLNGNALGGGCELATACDIRIAREDTSFGFVQSNIGILPGWGGGEILYKKVPSSFALDWLMTGSRYQAKVLLEKGWIHQVIKDEAWNNQEIILQDYINKSVDQMHLLKAQYKSHIHTENLSKLMREEVKNTASLWESPEHKAAVQKFWARNN